MSMFAYVFLIGGVTIILLLILTMCVIFFGLWRKERRERVDVDFRLRQALKELRESQEKLRPLARKVMASKNEVVWRDKKLCEIEETLKRYFPEAFLTDADRKDTDWGWRLNRIQGIIRHQRYGLDGSPSEPKSNRQIGLEYEMSVAHEYRLHGYKVDLRGSRLGYDDMGIDVIAKRDGRTVLIQCKYWGYGKLIRENIVCQLKGSWDFYLLKNHLPRENVQARIITNIYLSETAKEVADALGIVYEEGHEKVIVSELKADVANEDGGNDDMPDEIEWDEIPLYQSRLPEDI